MAHVTEDIKEVVKENYGAIARGEKSGCGCASKELVAMTIGYSKEELAAAGDANLGLGCGNPLALAGIKPGMTVLDLGSGAGFDRPRLGAEFPDSQKYYICLDKYFVSYIFA